jgi:phosphate transport system substrate-binding protein
MNKKHLASVVAAASIAGLLFASPALATTTTIAGSGSSFAGNAAAYAIASYDSADVVSYAPISSGTGRSNLNTSSYHYAISDGTYAISDAQPSSYTMVPLVGGPVVFAYNSTKTFNAKTTTTVNGKKTTATKAYHMPTGLKLNAAVISGIFKGTIAKWNDAAIKKLNPGAVLPSHAINVYYRVSGSGTTANLTTYLNQMSGSTWTTNSKDLQVAAGGTLAGGAVAKSNSSLLSTAVKNDLYGFGYFDLSDAVATKVNKASLKNAVGQFVQPTAAAGAKFLNAQGAVANAGQRTDGTLSIDFTKKVSGAYQLSIVTYGIAKNGGGASTTAVKNFFTYFVNTAMPRWAATHGYIPLTGSLKTAANAQIASIN